MNKLKLIINIIFFLSCFHVEKKTNAQVQNHNCHENIELIRSLISSKKPHETLLLLNSLLNNNFESNSQNDSLYFFKGFVHYQLKQFDSAIYNLLKVQQPDTLYNHAIFLAIVNAMYHQKINLADSLVGLIRYTSDYTKEFKNLYQASINLYMRSENKFLQHKNNFSYQYYTLQNEQKKILELYQICKTHRRKSPFKAAIYSTVVPGSGKWYSGSRAQAVTSFLTVSILGLISSENIVKRGWTHPISISSLGITSIFYIGNIYGSYHLAKIKNKELDEKINQDILYYLHVAYRNFYY